MEGDDADPGSGCFRRSSDSSEGEMLDRMVYGRQGATKVTTKNLVCAPGFRHPPPVRDFVQ